MSGRFIAIVLFFFFLCQPSIAEKFNNDSLVHALNAVVNNREYYINQKKEKIIILKELLVASKLETRQEYEINQKIYQEYKKYKIDSALHYVEKNKEIAEKLKDENLLNENALQRAYLYSTKGLFVESQKILKEFKTKNLPKDILQEYYKTCGFYNDHYAQSTEEYKYYKISDLYRDSLFTSINDTLSIDFLIVKSQDALYRNQLETAYQNLSDLLKNTTDNNPHRATIAYWLSVIYREKGDDDMEEKYLMISVINDIINVTKDNASLHSLALLYYKQGNIDKAYKFMTMAMEDAIACNVRYRASEALVSYPIINSAYQEKEKKHVAKLRLSLIIISILAAFLIGTIIYIYKQMKRVSYIRKELYNSSVKLIELNQNISNTNKELHELNVQLIEASRLKEEYIAHFFDICSEYVRKIDEYRKGLNKLAANNSMSELFAQLKSTNIIDTELEELHNRFDKIFLNLFPTFVNDFNELLIEVERSYPKPNELLNTELRIFALIRLGITDSVKIASFLRYSLSTIYNYRTKARNKAAVSRNNFEEMVMKIGIIQ